MAIFSINVYSTYLSRIHNCRSRTNYRDEQLGITPM